MGEGGLVQITTPVIPLSCAVPEANEPTSRYGFVACLNWVRNTDRNNIAKRLLISESFASH